MSDQQEIAQLKAQVAQLEKDNKGLTFANDFHKELLNLWYPDVKSSRFITQDELYALRVACGIKVADYREVTSERPTKISH